MKIALLHDFLLRLGGAERVLEEFSKMFPDAPIFTLLYNEEKCGSVFPRERVRTSFLQNIPFSRKFHRALLPLMPTAIESFDFSDFDFLLSSSTALSHGAIVTTKTRHISYIHSPARYLWDYTHQYLREQENFLKKIIAKRIIHRTRKWDLVASTRAENLLANSNNTQSRIKKFWHLDSEVVYPFIDTNKFKVSHNKEDYFLIISQLSQFKRIDLAISAFNKIRKKLLIVGDGPQRKFLESIAGDNIDFLGRVSDEEAILLLQNCRAFIFPGEEDFGIAPLEANACGKPIVALRKGGLMESQVEGVTARFFDKATTNSLEEAITSFIREEDNYKPEKIRKNAERFSKEKFRKRILDFF